MINTKSTFLARNALASPTLVYGSPRAQGPDLPMPSSHANLGLNKPAIGWMSAKRCQMFSFKHVVMLISSLTILAMGATSASAEEPNDRFVRLSFSDGRADISGLDAVNEQLLRVGVRIFEIPIPQGARPLIANSRHRALNQSEHNQLLLMFALDRPSLLEIAGQAGRAPAVEGGGALSISEEGVPPYPKVYDMKALDDETVAFLMRKFGRLHVNRADSGRGIDEVMTIVSGGPYTWFFVLEDGAVAKVRFSEVREGEHGWRISYPGIVPHGGYFDAEHGLVIAHAHGPETFVMRYSDPTVRSANTLNDNPWIDFSSDPPRLLDRPRGR